ncbi:hypothetical protein PFICI_11460 [Pestalotiopsis fici W106-1]|uniref:histidine kinase n=1 Tax=Pestalotiopsis fici (strain W106-1 / CGMCC3.15140) TaxID=1229662 RepID=W3WQE3_PESFW|nr:uncharacterized protein PFICI_11460 [Pestalotiopsis fici W106-1]ETS76073.1 hypothetical protein PFICI_11460 [Pestalotiopsis fici W106-1]
MADPTRRRQKPFYPKADAAVLLSSKSHWPPPARSQTVWPIFDPDTIDEPLTPWSQGTQEAFFPCKIDEYAASPIPGKPLHSLPHRYLRASLAQNERLRLSMLWYYTRNIFDESEFLCGLKEKVFLAQESTGWEFAVIGLLDINIYIRLATIGLPLGDLPRGETICAHTVIQPPGSVFLLPNMLEDWRFCECPYVEAGGLVAYAGAPLRLQNEFDETVSLGSFCVASSTAQPSLTKAQQSTLARLADSVVSDIVQCTRIRRQRDRHRMSGLVATFQSKGIDALSQDYIIKVLKDAYPDALISLHPSKALQIHLEGREAISISDIEDGLWEDFEFLDDFITHRNHQDLPCDRVVRLISAEVQETLGPSLLVVASKDVRLVFDDVDSWFVQTCADTLTQIWKNRLLTEAMLAKETFLRGFSHQLRTPIHGILGSAELLAEELGRSDLRESFRQASEALDHSTLGNNSNSTSLCIDTIMTAGRDLTSIINNMITLNKWADIASKDLSSVALDVYRLESELAKETLPMITSDTRYTTSILFNCTPLAASGSFNIDFLLLRDTLLPILVNAIQNSPKGAIMVTISLPPDSQELVIDIEDNGCGVHLSDQQRIFEAYEKVGVYSTGAGLGLTLASKFAALLNGSVSLVSSTIGCGSIFRAKFNATESVPAPRLLPEAETKLGNLPSQFCFEPTIAGATALCKYFTKFLACRGFTPWDKAGDFFTIVEFIPNAERSRERLLQIPQKQVVICLVPAAHIQLSLENESSNVVYARAPFLTSTLIAALEEADRLASAIQVSKDYPGHCEILSAALAETSDSQSADETNSSLSSTCSTESTTQSSLDSGVHPELTPSPLSGLVSDIALREKPKERVPLLTPLLTVSKPTALLVDDNKVNLRVMEMYCKKRGLSFFCAMDGLEAIEVFSKQQSLFGSHQGSGIDLILMDLQMPNCDGIDATKQIRLLEEKMGWRKTTIFIITGQDSPKDRVNSENAGADDYYVKPLSMKLLDCGVKAKFPAFDAS